MPHTRHKKTHEHVIGGHRARWRHKHKSWLHASRFTIDGGNQCKECRSETSARRYARMAAKLYKPHDGLAYLISKPDEPDGAKR